VADGCDHVAAGLAGTLYYGAGHYAVVDIAPVYCPTARRPGSTT